VKNLAKITLKVPGGLTAEIAEAFLGEERVWYSSNRLVQSILRMEQTRYSPADGEPGAKMLAEATDSFRRRGFTVRDEWLAEDTPAPPGVVY
jgi:hypothetical protein